MPDHAAAQSYWAGKAGDWVQWADPVARLAEKINIPFLESIDLAPGHRLLDLASGAGEPAMSALSIAGENGLVVATDFVPGMLTGLQKRPGADQMKLAAADMQALPFADTVFDRISCRFGIMFVPDPAAVARECRRILSTDGVCGFMIWGPQEDQTLFSILSQAVFDILGQEPDSHHQSIFRFGRKGDLQDIFLDAGFHSVVETDQYHKARAHLDRPFWQAQLHMTYGHLLTDLDQAALDHLNNHILCLFKDLPRDEQGSTILNSHTRILIAQKG
ncbi:ubiquinone/menaquinone biosynthesis C-methylase UbiE [Aestuariispira insulae]|uniref:Ubiquinone/menaquinone biosynthesis C-methylase UbiE n=1 Tax=Aestuariispira insulae TaxID=1461337 RepID=A0A3D9HVK2_9PROT|nr:ubiquinone/menaquinone biosynthesis C-methylase UbiE [Aestuariispira insulae]